MTWRLACTFLFHSLCQDQSTVAQQAETTVAECSHQPTTIMKIMTFKHVTKPNST